jgi:TonB family protein
MTKRDFRQAPNRLVYNNGREPVTAAFLSVIPGLGQLYNGQSIKGLLFIDVAVVNTGLLAIVLFAEPMAKGLRELLTGNHVRPNDGILQALSSAHLGTPFSLVLLSMILLFVGFAIRDAYDYARGEKLKPIYADSALHLSEAASGSYLFHFAAMISCAIFALFFLVPKPERQQIMEIEFTQTPIKDVAPVKPKKFSDEASSARHRDVSVQKPSPPTSTASRSQSATQSNRTQTPPKPPTAVNRTPAKEPPTKTEEPAPPTVRPMPTAVKHATSTPNPNPNPNPITAPKSASPGVTANTTPAPTLSKAPPTSAPGPLPTLAPVSTATGPSPQALTHNSGSTLAPMPAEGRRSSSSKSDIGGAPAPVSATSGTAPNGNPSPIDGAHPRGTSSSQTGSPNSPTKIASTLPPGGAFMVHPVGTPAIPRTDSKGLDTQSGKGKGVEDIGKNIDFGPYMAELQRRIKRNWTPPKDPMSRQVIVEFTIARSGELGTVRLSKSSGLSLNDQAAISAIRAAAPYPPLPKGADETVDIQFTFDYRIFGGHASY